MPTPSVVEVLDVVEHVGSGFVACPVDLALARCARSSARRRNCHRGVVPDIAGAAGTDRGCGRWCIGCHDRSDATTRRVAPRQIAITRASVTGSAVIAALIDQHEAPEEIAYGGNVEPAFRRPDIREVGDLVAMGPPPRRSE